MLTILSLVAISQAWKLPPGAYTVPDLCARLSQATGVPHSAEAALQDYPVYLDLKTQTPTRVESLVATALRAKWLKGEKGLVLTHVVPPASDDFLEFQRQLTSAFAGKPYAGLSARDLYRMAPGSIQRFGTRTNDNVAELPKEMQDPSGKADVMWRVHRMTYGIFEISSQGTANDVLPFSKDSQPSFGSLPPAIENLMGGELENLVPISPKLKQALAQIAGGSKTDKPSDPVGILAETALENLDQAVSKDVVIALQDGAVMSLAFDGADAPKNVGDWLKCFTMVDNWVVEDGAAVAQLSATEARSRGQARREILNGYIAQHRGDNFLSMDAMSKYVDSQRSTASDTWMDAMLLSISHVGIPDQYIGDYPYNVRLFGSLSSDDWALLRSGKAIQLSALSGSAQQQMLALLLQSRSRMDPKEPDPGLWSTLAPDTLTLNVKFEESPVLVTWEPGGSQVGTVVSAADLYARQKRTQGKEPLYQTAKQQKFDITVTGSNGQSVKTGFANVLVTPGQAAVAWAQLPPDIASAFKTQLDQVATEKSVGRPGTPPP